MTKLFKTLDALFKKADNTESKYQDTLEQHQEQLISLEGELQEKNALLKDMHKMKLLGDVSEATYEAEREQVEKLQAKVQDIKKEMELIEVYKVEDVTGIIEELDAEKSRVFKGKEKELEKIRLELLDSKLSYLNKLQEARTKYNELVNPDRKLDEIKIKLGLKSMSYVSGSHDALSLYSVPTGYEHLRVEQYDVYQALEYGKVPERLNLIVQEAKEKGILEK